LQVAKTLQRKLITDNTQYIRYATNFQLHIGLRMHVCMKWHTKSMRMENTNQSFRELIYHVLDLTYS